MSQRFDESFRPLASSTVGAGALAVSILGFTGQIWASFGPVGRELVATAARTSLLLFLILVVALVLAYAARRAMGAGLRRAFNLYGVTAFAAGTLIIGQLVSRALESERPSTLPVPDQVLLLPALATLALAALALATGWRAIRSIRRPSESPERARSPTDD